MHFTSIYLLEILNCQPTTFRVMKILKKLQDFFETGKNCKLSMKRILSKEKIESRCVIYLSSPPVCVGHGDLIQIYIESKIIES